MRAAIPEFDGLLMPIPIYEINEEREERLSETTVWVLVYMYQDQLIQSLFSLGGCLMIRLLLRLHFDFAYLG